MMNAIRIHPLLIAIVMGLVTVSGSPAQESTPTIETLAQALNLAQGYTYGDDGKAMEFVRAEVIKVQQKPEARNDLANLLAALLADGNSTEAFKAFVCQQLYLIGGEDQIDELLPLLLDPKFAHHARYALEVIPSPQADTALWTALPKVDSEVAAGIVASLAARGGKGAVTRMVSALTYDNEDVVRAAITGLGRLGGIEAEVALEAAGKSLPDGYRPNLMESLLACADGYANENRPDEAIRLYNRLLAPTFSTTIRLAALRGLVDVMGPASTPLLLEAFASGDRIFVTAVCGYVRTVGTSDTTVAFTTQLGLQEPEVDVLLINALADRGDPLALDAILSMRGSADKKIQLAALDAIGDLGNEIHVPLLVDTLWSQDQEFADEARKSLQRMADIGVDGALLQELDGAEAEVQAELLGLLGDRQATAALPAVIELARVGTGDVQTAAIKNAGRLAREEDLPQLFALYLAMPDEASRTEAARALTATFRRVPPSEARTTLLADLYDQAPTAVTRSGLLGIYQALGDDSLLPLVLASAGADESIEQAAGESALIQWTTPAPLSDVLALADQVTEGARRNAALDGAVRMIRLPSARPEKSSLAGLEDVLRLSNDADILRRVLAALAELKSKAALDLAESLLDREDLHKDAAMAAEAIRRNFYTATASENSEAALKVMDDEINSLWESGAKQSPGQWIEIDMSRPARIKGVVLDNSRSKENFPRGYAVYVYAKGGERGAPVAAGPGSAGVTEINFDAVAGQLLRIELTTTADVAWKIHELRVVPD